MTQSIFFDVIARDRASQTFSKVARSTGSAESGMKRFTSTAGKLAGLVGAAGFGAGMVSFLKDSNAEAREAQKVGALTTQVIKSTGGAAKVTAAQVGDLASSISKKVGIDDEAIQSGANLLLTFKKVRNEVGKGNQIFDRATKAAVDLSAAGFGDLSGTAKQLGKALNDPIKGMTALGRSGVTFTEKQKAQIKALVETGDTLKAQKMILREVESQVGGAAEAQVTASDKARVAWGNLEEQIGTALLPTVDRLATFASDDLVPAISKFVSGMEDGTGAGGKFADMLGDAADMGKTALRIIEAIPGPVKKLGVEALIAYAAIRKLGPGITTLGGSVSTSMAKVKQFNAEMTYSATRSQAMSAGLQAMGGMLRNVAGTGGMLLLADSTSRAGTTLGTLESAAGGALSGAALGAFAGPPGAAIGAAIGGLSGAALSLMRGTQNAGDAARKAIGDWETYASTLDAATGATTELTRATVLEEARKAGVLKMTRSLDIADRQVVNALVSGGKARDKVVAAVKGEVAAIDQAITAKERELSANLKQAGDLQNLTSAQRKAAQDRAFAAKGELDDLRDLREARKKDADAILEGIGAVDKSIKNTRQAAAASRDYTGKLKGIPRAAKTQIKAEGIIPTTRAITELSKRFRLNPEQIRTVVSASGIKLTEGQIKHLIQTVQDYGKQHPAPKIDANTGPANQKLGAVEARLQKIAGQVYTATVQVLTFGGGSGGGGGGGKKGGRGGRSPERYMGDAGRTAGEAYAKGIDSKRMKVSKALDRYTGLASKAAERLSNLRGTRAGFLGTFSGESVFGADMTEGGSLSSLIQMQQQQAQQASILAKDVQSAVQMGLSKSLVAQLQAQGASGAAALRQIVMGGPGAISTLNALDAQTQRSLQQAGMTAGNYVRGGSVNADIASAAAEDARLERLVRKLRHLQGDDVVVINLDTETIIKAIKKRNRKKGVRTAGI